MFLENDDIAEFLAEMETEEVISVENEVIEDDVLVENRPVVEPRVYNIGDAVVLSANAVNAAGSSIPDRYKSVKVYIRSVKNDCYGFSLNKTGRTSGFLVKSEYLTPYVENIAPKEEFKNYLVLIKADELNIKSKPDTASNTLKTIHRDGLFTIVGEHNGWGHLKIGGWIPLDQVRKLNA